MTDFNSTHTSADSTSPPGPRSVSDVLKDLPDMLTSDEVADLLRVNKPTLRYLWRTGALPAPMAFNARLYRWKKAELIESLEKARVPQPKPRAE